MNHLRSFRYQPEAHFRLDGETCRVCNKPIFPPRGVCPHCTDAAEAKRTSVEQEHLVRRESEW